MTFRKQQSSWWKCPPVSEAVAYTMLTCVYNEHAHSSKIFHRLLGHFVPSVVTQTCNPNMCETKAEDFHRAETGLSCSETQRWSHQVCFVCVCLNGVPCSPGWPHYGALSASQVLGSQPRAWLVPYLSHRLFLI